jgi:hypothetical protein
MGDGLRPIGKPLDLPPYPKMPRAPHFYPDNEVDRMLERAKANTRSGKHTHIEYARYADDGAPRRREGVFMH